MANLKNVLKKNGGIKITRQDLLRKSPIPWTALILITLVVAGFMVWPNASDWMDKQSKLKAMAVEIPDMETKQVSLNNEKENLEIVFNEQAEPFIRVAEQRFPSEIKADNIAQIIEIYSILRKINYRASTLELNSVAVSTTQNVDGTTYAETPVTINILADRETLKDFIAFLKTSQITDELNNKVIASGGDEIGSIEFLTANILPVARINSLSMTEERGRNQSGGSNAYNTQLQVMLYSKPL